MAGSTICVATIDPIADFPKRPWQVQQLPTIVATYQAIADNPFGKNFSTTEQPATTLNN